VQLPPIVDGIYTFAMSSFTEAQQPPALPSPCAVPEISVSSSVDVASAQVGDQLDFTYTVTNTGTTDLTTLQVASALPSGLDYVSASNQGAVNPDTGYIEWSLGSGLATGESTQLSVSATVVDAGQLTNNVCAAGSDVTGSVATDCATATVLGTSPAQTPTTTATTTGTPTVTATVTPTGTNTPTAATTASPTVLPSGTPTISATGTPTISATGTPTAAPPDTRTATPINTLAPTAVPSDTPTTPPTDTPTPPP
jgi:uncharacterized repeat protein (TIGR01451 family)